MAVALASIRPQAQELIHNLNINIKELNRRIVLLLSRIDSGEFNHAYDTSTIRNAIKYNIKKDIIPKLIKLQILFRSCKEDKAIATLASHVKFFIDVRRSLRVKVKPLEKAWRDNREAWRQGLKDFRGYLELVRLNLEEMSKKDGTLNGLSQMLSQKTIHYKRKAA